MQKNFLRSSLRAFTLVELLVAMAVLMAVTVMVTSLISNVTKTTQLATEAIGTESSARLLFNQLGRDIEAMIVRNDVDYLFGKENQADDRLGFYVSSPASDGLLPISRVYYQYIGNELSRAVQDASENSIAPIFVNAVDLEGGASFGTPPADDQFMGFGSDIIRFEYAFLVKDSGGLLTVHDLNYLDSNDQDTNRKVEELAGIIVAIAVLDQKSQVMLNNDASGLAAELGDSNSIDIASSWRAKLDSLDKTTALGMAGSKVRLYQRIFLFP